MHAIDQHQVERETEADADRSASSDPAMGWMARWIPAEEPTAQTLREVEATVSHGLTRPR